MMRSCFVPRVSALLGGAAALIALCGSAAAQGMPPAATPAKEGFFPFVIPWDDAASGAEGSVTDVSYLNAKPAGLNGRIIVRNGHFVETKTGTRVRFLGTNFSFAANFPRHEDATKIAAHLAKLGINIVRIHHHDADYGLLWDKSQPNHQQIAPTSRDRLDFLIAELKKNGIYVNLNLHVSRKFTAADGFPASVEQIALAYDKRVDNYDRRMIELQKQFARDYLTHINPYTKQSYVADPCVAMVEINNENSLVDQAAENLSAGLSDLPEPFQGDLAALWNQWLRKKYRTDTALRDAWRAGVTPPGPSLVNGASRWILERQGSSVAALTSAPATGAEVSATGPEAAPPVAATVRAVDGTDWHIQAQLTGLDLKEGANYTLRFRAKADTVRRLKINAGLDQADWRRVGMEADASLGTDWQTYQYTFAASQVVPGHSRIAFVLGDQIGTISLRDVSLRPGVDAALAAPAGSLTDATVRMPQTGTALVRRDWLHFLSDTERAYADEMRGYLKATLGVASPIIHSQISWGGAAGLYREAEMDFADNHAYWNHPNFPGRSWDPKNWTIANRPMVGDLATGGRGTLLGLAEYRVAGKPYTISEYNQPAPSDFQCEMVPEIAAFAAAQDWDALFLFDYGGYGAGAPSDRIQGFFGIGSNPAKAAFLPAAALLFREARIAPLTAAKTLDLTAAALRDGVPLAKLWLRAAPETPVERLGIRHSVRLAATGRLAKGPAAHSGAAAASPVRVTNEAGGRFTVATGSVGASAGFLGGGSEVRLGSARIQVASFGNNFCALTLTPLDADTRSPSLLLTLVGKVENANMGWNGRRTSVGNQWGTGPSLAEFVPATVTVPAPPGSLVWALDATGRRSRAIPVTFAGGLLTFRTDAAARTVWYEIARAK
ncbi:MAG: carbohydrate binding domain-containing protein [Cytophagales bacterium]|nr:carbohydrate binding domain-containing protein [Armatimonadota bacterium]